VSRTRVVVVSVIGGEVDAKVAPDDGGEIAAGWLRDAWAADDRNEAAA
jgi:hypothetical protein